MKGFKSTIVKLLVLPLFLMGSMAASASNAWYSGVVTNISLLGNDSFVVTLDTSALDDCKCKYAYFNAGQIGVDTAKQAYTMALTSLTTGKTMGIVIDKSINGTGGECDATGMVASLH